MQPNFDAMNKAQNAKQINLAEWRASQLHELLLPSGLTITLKDITMTELMLSGQLPGSILAVAEEVKANGQQSIDLKQIAKNGAEFGAMLNMIVKLSLIWPKLGDVPDDETATLDDFSGDDKMAIFNFINREVEQLKSFREGEDKPVAAIQHGDSLRETTEPVSGS